MLRFLLVVLPLASLAQTWTRDELLGRFDPATHPAFVRVDPTCTQKPDIYLRREVNDALVRMVAAARKDGIALNVISATRNFTYQKGIWERKWGREKYDGWSAEEKARDILRFSSMPGTSRHHWGTDVDFNSVEAAYFDSATGKRVYDWLVAHAAEFGFYQTYTEKSSGRTGYEEEPWHWSYFPTAGPMLKEYNTTITASDITGFKGAETAAAIDVIRLYVNGIAPAPVR